MSDTWESEVRVRTKDGRYRWIQWQGVPCVEEQTFVAACQDVTRRKIIEDELRESQERFDLVASASTNATWDWDLRTDRIWRSDTYLRLLGAPEEDPLTIEWWRSRVHPDDIERLLEQIPAPTIDGRHRWTLEYRIRRVDGSYAQVYDQGTTIFDRDGQPVRMVGSIIDITELKHAEEQLRESEERFRLAARATRDAIWDWDIRRGNGVAERRIRDSVRLQRRGSEQQTELVGRAHASG